MNTEALWKLINQARDHAALLHRARARDEGTTLALALHAVASEWEAAANEAAAALMKVPEE